MFKKVKTQMTSSLIMTKLTSNMTTQQQVIKGNFFLTYQDKMEGNKTKDFTIKIKVESLTSL
jgi:hypothetical protein